MTLCVYALTGPRTGRLTVTGLADERLQLVRVQSVAAIVGTLPRLPRPTEANLRKYDRLMRSLADRLPAVAPVRFGTCVRNVEELTFDLRARQASLKRSLAALRHRAQMTLRLVTAPPVHSAGAPATQSGAEFLRSRARVLDVPGFEPVRDAVRRWVREERVEHRAGVTSIYHLVPRSSAAAYRKALERAAAASGVRLQVSGPWPAYAFADEW